MLAALSGTLPAQSFQRRASMTGRASGDREKCTIEVVVDGAAEIQIRGDNATLRNISGQPPQWRRFECSAPMPPNPVNFRFSGVDGRGRQQLVSDPRNGGAAVVRIEDSDNGSEGYTFDITWGGRGDVSGDRGRPFEQPPVSGGRFTAERAIQVCQDAIRAQASQRFRAADVRFRQINTDDNPGRNDWVVGIIDVRRGPGREEPYRFSCSVNFDNGRVRSAEIQAFGEDRSGGPGRVGGPGREGGYGREAGEGRAVDACQRAVEERVRRDGYDRVSFPSINMDDRPGRNDWVVGVAEANRRDRRPDSFDFSCSVDLRDGDLRSVDVHRR
jgi:hypothetical protein